MPRGGSRVGAGRKKGQPNKKTQAMIEKAASEGIMPKDVLLNAMRYFYAAGDLEKAAEIAKDAAPYYTPRLSAIAHKSIDDALPDFDFLIETVDEHGNVIAIPPPTPTASGADEVPVQ